MVYSLFELVLNYVAPKRHRVPKCALHLDRRQLSLPPCPPHNALLHACDDGRLAMVDHHLGV